MSKAARADKISTSSIADDTSGLMAASLRSVLEGATSLADEESHPDAELLRIDSVHAQVWATSRAAWAEADTSVNDPEPAVSLIAAADCVGDQISGLRATTLDGLRAKAQAYRRSDHCLEPGHSTDTDILVSLVDDILNLERLENLATDTGGPAPISCQLTTRDDPLIAMGRHLAHLEDHYESLDSERTKARREGDGSKEIYVESDLENTYNLLTAARAAITLSPAQSLEGALLHIGLAYHFATDVFDNPDIDGYQRKSQHLRFDRCIYSALAFLRQDMEAESTSTIDRLAGPHMNPWTPWGTKLDVVRAEAA